MWSDFVNYEQHYFYLVNRDNCKNIPAQKSSSNTILLRERIVSLQQQNSLLQSARKAAESSAKEYKEANQKLLHQQQISDQRFQTSRQTIKVQRTLRLNYRRYVEHMVFCFTCGFSSHFCETCVHVLKNLRSWSRFCLSKLGLMISHGVTELHVGDMINLVTVPNLTSDCVMDLRYFW